MSPDPTATAALAPRELQVLKFMARGLTNEEIGQELYVTSNTVKATIHRISVKDGCG